MILSYQQLYPDEALLHVRIQHCQRLGQYNTDLVTSLAALPIWDGEVARLELQRREGLS